MKNTNTTYRGLREARERAGLSRAQLAGMAGCSNTLLANVECGALPRHSPTLDRVLALLAELEKTRKEE